MAGNHEERTVEYKELAELCEKYQMDGFAESLRKKEIAPELLKERIGESLRQNLELWYEDKRVYEESLSSFSEEVDKGYLKIKEKLLGYMDGQYYELGRDQVLTAIWLKCGNNLTVYGELFSYLIRESGVKDYCEELIKSYSRFLRKLVQRMVDGLCWHENPAAVEINSVVTFGEEQLKRDGDEVYLADDFLFRLLQTANAYGFGNAVRLLSGAELLQKAIDIGQKALMWYLDSCSDQCNKHLKELYDHYSDIFKKTLKQAFFQQAGREPEEIREEIRETERDMTRFDLYGDVPYYPFRHNGRLEFLQSIFYRKLLEEEEAEKEEPVSGQEAARWADALVFEPYYAEKSGESKAKIYSALFAYNGTAAVKMPLIYSGTEKQEENRELERFCPWFHRIVWGDFGKDIQKAYKRRRDEFQRWCAQRWDGQCKRREEEILRQTIKSYQAIFEGELSGFIRVWRQWKKEISEQQKVQESTKLAAMNMDAFTYYQWYYYPVHPTEHTLRFLYEYRQTGKISPYLSRGIGAADTRGISMRPAVTDQFKVLFRGYLEQLAESST